MAEDALKEIAPAAIAFVLCAVILVIGVYVVTQLPSSGGSDGYLTSTATNSYAQVNSSTTYSLSYSPLSTGTFTLKNTSGTAIAYNSLSESAGTFLVNASWASVTDGLGTVTNNTVYNLSKRLPGYPLRSASGQAINGSAANVTVNATFNYTTGFVTFDGDLLGVNVTYYYDKGTSGAVAAYTYQYTTGQVNASTNALKGLSTFASMLPLLALGLAAAVVIFLIAGVVNGGKGDLGV